jgi:hypothetical protein
MVSGAAQVTSGQSGVGYSVYPVAGATSYVWSLPTGASITSGAGTASITVVYSSGAMSGTISVKGINICGDGISSPTFSVTVSAGVPATQAVQNVIVSSGQNPCYNATQTITVAGTGTTFTLQNGGTVTMIAGQNIRFLPGASVLSGGHLHAYIRPSGPWCNTAKSGEAIYAEGEIEASPDTPSYPNDLFTVYPNPTTDKIHVVMKVTQPCESFTGMVFNVFGKTVKTINITKTAKAEIYMGELPSGLYFLRLSCGIHTRTVKIIKN